MRKQIGYALAALVMLGFSAETSKATSQMDTAFYLVAGGEKMKSEGRERHRDHHRDRDGGGVTLFGGPSFGMEFGGRHGGPAFGFRVGDDGYSSRSYRDRGDECDIKGIYRADGSREYLTPDNRRYDRVRASRWFCSERQAERAGFDPYTW